MLILALDQATSKTGWSLWEDSKLVDSGVFKTPSKMKYEDRLTFMKLKIAEVHKTNKLDKMFIEGIQLEMEEGQKDISVDTFRKLAHLQGIIIQWSNENNVDLEIISPSTWKSKINIFYDKRKTQKLAAQRYVKDNFGKEVTEDEADAICIGASQLATKKLAW